jgi:hypothetical protein
MKRIFSREKYINDTDPKFTTPKEERSGCVWAKHFDGKTLDEAREAVGYIVVAGIFEEEDWTTEAPEESE